MAVIMAMDTTITIVVLTLTLVQFIFTWAVQTMDMVTDTDITTDMVAGKVRYITLVDKISTDNFCTVFMRHK